MKREYYLLGETTPICVLSNDGGYKISAELPSKEKRALVPRATYLSRLEHSFEVDRITEAEFYRQCAVLWDKWGTPE